MTDDELLMEYLRTKDNGLLTTLYERMHDGLCAVARRIAPNDADDIVQDALCKLCELEPQEVNSGFMVKMVQNLALDRKRSRRRRREASLDSLIQPGHDDAHPIDQSDSAESQLERQELLDEVASAVASLPPKQREAVELYYGHGCTIAEAATIMAVEQDAVETWIRRGRDHLREILVIAKDSHISAKILRQLLETMYANAG